MLFSIPRSRCWSALILLMIALLVSACSWLPGRPKAVTLLTLEVPAFTATEIKRKNSVLLLDSVEEVPALRSTRVLYRRQGPLVFRYARHRWLVMPAELIDQTLMESLALQLPYASVVRPEQGLAADRELSLTLLRLEQQFVTDGRSQEHLEVFARLLDLEHGRVMGSRLFHYREAAPEPTAEGGAVAAGAALGHLFSDLLVWLSEIDR